MARAIRERTRCSSEMCGMVENVRELCCYVDHNRSTSWQFSRGGGRARFNSPRSSYSACDHVAGFSRVQRQARQQWRVGGGCPADMNWVGAFWRYCLPEDDTAGDDLAKGSRSDS